MAETGSSGNRYLNIELMRFVGILLIMGHHLYQIGFEGQYYLFNCCVWIDFFFIVTGALTYRHFVAKAPVSKASDQAGSDSLQSEGYGSIALRYTFNKYKRFFVLTVITLICLYLVYYGDLIFKGDIHLFVSNCVNAPFEMLFLTSSGVARALNSPIWFLSAMFIVFPLIVYLIQAHREFWKVLSLLFPIVYFGHFGVGINREWPHDMLRAFAAIALGTVAYELAGAIAGWVRSNGKEASGTAVNTASPLKTALLSCAEIVCIALAAFITVTNKECINLTEPLFVFAIALMMSGATWSSGLGGALKDTAGKESDGICTIIITFIGKMAMPMYITHWLVGTLVSRISVTLTAKTVIYYAGTVIIGAIWVLATRGKRSRS